MYLGTGNTVALKQSAKSKQDGKIIYFAGYEMAKIIDLKILPDYFSPVEKGVKKFEIRYNDRDYAVGDMLILREYDGERYTGRRVAVKITYIFNGGTYGVSDGYVSLSIEKIKRRDRNVKKNN